MVHPKDASVPFVLDVTRNALLGCGMELGGLLVAEVRARVTANACFGFNPCDR
jgi:hypothetical protein